MELSSISIAITSLVSALFSPGAIFTTGVNGAWYDPSDFSTMFQDAAGTTPVTAVGQPVGLMLDKSKGLVLGPEKWTTNPTIDANWTKNGDGSFTSNGNSGFITVAINGVTVNGKWYKATMTIKSATAGLVSIPYDGTSPKYYGSAGTYTWYFPADADGGLYIYASGFAGTIDNISVRELPGNHAFNPSGNSANFPVLQQDGTGRYYLAFNGVNQWLQTNSIDFTYGDKMFVSAGVRKLSDAATGLIAELSSVADTNNGSFLIAAPGGPSLNDYTPGLRGTAFALRRSNNFAAPLSSVISTSMDISGSTRETEISPKVNGTIPASITGAGAADAGTGNYGNYPLYIGARAGSSLWFNGRLYGLVVAGKQASASEITNTESWLNQKTGAY